MATAPSLTESIAARLRNDILGGTYKAGERLPAERDLASRLGVNRGSVREALKKLEQMGLVVIRRDRRSGAFAGARASRTAARRARRDRERAGGRRRPRPWDRYRLCLSAAIRSSSGGCVMNRRAIPLRATPDTPNAAS